MSRYLGLETQYYSITYLQLLQNAHFLITFHVSTIPTVNNTKLWRFYYTKLTQARIIVQMLVVHNKS